MFSVPLYLISPVQLAFSRKSSELGSVQCVQSHNVCLNVIVMFLSGMVQM